MKKSLALIGILIGIILLSVISLAGYAQEAELTPEEVKAGKQAQKYFKRMEKTAQEKDEKAISWFIAKDIDEIKKMGKDAIPSVIEVVKDKSKNRVMRSMLINEVVGELRDSRAVKPLTEMLKDKTDDDKIRTLVGRTLGKIGDKEAIPSLVEMAEDKTNGKNVRRGMIGGLANTHIADKSSIEPLRNILTDSDWEIRMDAAFALEMVGRQTQDSRPATTLIDIFKNKNEVPIVREHAMASLGRMKDARAVEPLIKILQEEGYVSAAQALGDLGDSRAVPALIQALKVKEGLLRIYAAKALVKLNAKEGIQPMQNILNTEEKIDPYEKEVLQNAIEKLNK